MVAFRVVVTQAGIWHGASRRWFKASGSLTGAKRAALLMQSFRSSRDAAGLPQQLSVYCIIPGSMAQLFGIHELPLHETSAQLKPLRPEESPRLPAPECGFMSI